MVNGSSDGLAEMHRDSKTEVRSTTIRSLDEINPSRSRHFRSTTIMVTMITTTITATKVCPKASFSKQTSLNLTVSSRRWYLIHKSPCLAEDNILDFKVSPL